MKTKLEDLEADEREMLEAKAQIENKIDVIRQMIEMMKTMRSPKTIKTLLSANTTVTAKLQTLRSALYDEIEKSTTGWISAGDISKLLLDAVGRDKKWVAYRASVSSTLRKMSEKGEIQRHNKGTKGEPIYIYGSNELGEYRGK